MNIRILQVFLRYFPINYLLLIIQMLGLSVFTQAIKTQKSIFELNKQFTLQSKASSFNQSNFMRFSLLYALCLGSPKFSAWYNCTTKNYLKKSLMEVWPNYKIGKMMLTCKSKLQILLMILPWTKHQIYFLKMPLKNRVSWISKSFILLLHLKNCTKT